MTAEKPNGNGTKWWGTYAPIAAAVAVIGGSIITFFVQIGTLSYQMAQSEARYSALERRIGKMEGAVQGLQINNAGREKGDCQIFAKIETQMGTVETIINEMRVDDLRTRGAFWDKIYGQPYSSAFYEIKIPHEIIPC